MTSRHIKPSRACDILSVLTLCTELGHLLPRVASVPTRIDGGAKGVFATTGLQNAAATPAFVSIPLIHCYCCAHALNAVRAGRRKRPGRRVHLPVQVKDGGADRGEQERSTPECTLCRVQVRNAPGIAWFRVNPKRPRTVGRLEPVPGALRAVTAGRGARPPQPRPHRRVPCPYAAREHSRHIRITNIKRAFGFRGNRSS